jgi:hypothetical protein
MLKLDNNAYRGEWDYVVGTHIVFDTSPLPVSIPIPRQYDQQQQQQQQQPPEPPGQQQKQQPHPEHATNSNSNDSCFDPDAERHNMPLARDQSATSHNNLQTTTTATTTTTGGTDTALSNTPSSTNAPPLPVSSPDPPMHQASLIHNTTAEAPQQFQPTTVLTSSKPPIDVEVANQPSSQSMSASSSSHPLQTKGGARYIAHTTKLIRFHRVLLEKRPEFHIKNHVAAATPPRPPPSTRSSVSSSTATSPSSGGDVHSDRADQAGSTSSATDRTAN